ncbi:FAD-binding protein [Streptomyces sp. NPDC007896]|uniref:FAD-binding protein n=1 Tax=Streptomyces sp. NPDC007896 TaxID=3364784 RepID=UPI0036ED2706
MTLNQGLSMQIDTPSPDEEIPVGVDFMVSGTAVGAEPDSLRSVTVQVDTQPLVTALLSHLPPQFPGAFAFRATVRLSSPGEHQVKATATSSSGSSVTGQVAVAAPDTSHCRAGVEWDNYPATQSLVPYSTCTPQTLAGVVAVVREAEMTGKHVHAFGSKWSFSDCAFSFDYVLDTRRLNQPLQTVKRALRPGQSSLLYHVEAGITVRDLYTSLDREGFALETMGGASGQTLAGAVSTGTHGGDKFMPPLADSVLAMHMVGAGGVQYWIEPSSGITDPARLQAHVVPDVAAENIVYDDETFNACLVSLGCMGVIYALVLQVRPKYDLVETTTETTWQAFRDSAAAELANTKNRFLQVLVSPYPDASSGNNLCLVTTRYEEAVTKQAERPQGNVEAAVRRMINDLSKPAKLILHYHDVFKNGGLPNEQRLAMIVHGILTYTPDQRPVLVAHYDNLLRAFWPAGEWRGTSYSVMDIGYSNPIPATQPGYSIELFFPSMDLISRFVTSAMEVINGATATFLTGYVSLRFTAATRAALGMQQWPTTCAVEITMIQGVPGDLQLMTELYRLGMDWGALPHWGQLIDLGIQGAGRVHPQYPQYPQWRHVYAKMSNNFAARTFENGLSARWNLTTPNDAMFIAQAVPKTMRAGESQQVTVTMQNSGISTWRASQNPFRLGSQRPQDNNVWGLNRRDVPTEAAPGATVDFSFDIIAPQVPGYYEFQWRMVEEWIGWFGEYTPRVTIGISPPAGRTMVPDVIGLSSDAASHWIVDAGLRPTFTGSDYPGAWVFAQTPGGDTVADVDSTVSMALRTGPVP